MQRYLTDVLAKTRHNVDSDKVLLVTEFGDWVLPSLPANPGAPSEKAEPFWAATELGADIAAFPWPGTVDDFVRGTHAYKGIDRLQIELFRRVPGIAGSCLTQLADVPHEYNGLWELDRTPKDDALHQVAAACRATLPMALHVRPDPTAAETSPEPAPPLLGAWNGWTGEDIHLSLVVSHDHADMEHANGHGPRREPLRRGCHGRSRRRNSSRPHKSTPPLSVSLRLPAAPGRHDLVLSLASEEAAVAPVRNVYNVHVFERPTWRGRVSVIGSDRGIAAVAAAGATVTADGPLVVGEGAASEQSLPRLDDALRGGQNVLLLAQTPESAAALPVSAAMADIATEWGSVPFLFSTAETMLSAVPARAVVTTELLSITPRFVYTSLAGGGWPKRLVLGMYKPSPGRLAAPVVGAVPVHRGLVWFCQLPLVDAALADDPTAVTTLSELLRAVTQAPGVTT